MLQCLYFVRECPKFQFLSFGGVVNRLKIKGVKSALKSIIEAYAKQSNKKDPPGVHPSGSSYLAAPNIIRNGIIKNMIMYIRSSPRKQGRIIYQVPHRSPNQRGAETQRRRCYIKAVSLSRVLSLSALNIQ